MAFYIIVNLLEAQGTRGVYEFESNHSKGRFSFDGPTGELIELQPMPGDDARTHVTRAGWAVQKRFMADGVLPTRACWAS